MFDHILFFERVTTLCKQKGLSVSGFATSVLKLSSGTATQWKNGVVPSASIVFSIADYFEVSSDYILGLSDDPKRTSDYDPDNLIYLYNYINEQISAHNTKAYVLICNLFKRYLEDTLYAFENNQECTLEDVFEHSISEEKARAKASDEMRKRGEAMISRRGNNE